MYLIFCKTSQSLLFGGSRSIVGTISSSRLSLRQFQTVLSAVSTSKTKDEKHNITTTTKLPSMQVSSISTVAKLSSFKQNQQLSIGSIIHQQTMRSMAGLSPSDNQFINGKPTLEYAKKLPKTFASMTNEQVMQFAELGIPEACRECVIRDVMVVDQIEYDEAMKVFNEIAKTNREGMDLAATPFYVGLSAAVIGGYGSIPLVFNLSAVHWFNENFVTAELPPRDDLETWLEVGSASWGWMEPVLGQVSFFLLCMQFARSQLQNLGIRPYFHWQSERRARYLVQKYPQYDAQFLMTYSRNDKLSEPHEMSS